MRLTVLRHAHASDAPLGGEDFDRPLSPAGREAARSLASVLAAELLPPDRLRVSAAARTRQTAELACVAAWPGVALDVASSLYSTSLDRLLKDIAATPDACRHLMIVGHNPGLSELWSAIGGEAAFPGLAPCQWRSRELDARSWAAVLG
jgi:phosphohistidine phosphatase